MSFGSLGLFIGDLQPLASPDALDPPPRPQGLENKCTIMARRVGLCPCEVSSFFKAREKTLFA